MTEKEEPGQLVGFEKMAQRILESFEKRMEQFILQAVKKSQGTVYNRLIYEIVLLMEVLPITEVKNTMRNETLPRLLLIPTSR